MLAFWSAAVFRRFDASRRAGVKIVAGLARRIVCSETRRGELGPFGTLDT
jgi:hypothetical protein